MILSVFPDLILQGRGWIAIIYRIRGADFRTRDKRADQGCVQFDSSTEKVEREIKAFWFVTARLVYFYCCYFVITTAAVPTYNNYMPHEFRKLLSFGLGSTLPLSKTAARAEGSDCPQARKFSYELKWIQACFQKKTSANVLCVLLQIIIACRILQKIRLDRIYLKMTCVEEIQYTCL